MAEIEPVEEVKDKVEEVGVTTKRNFKERTEKLESEVKDEARGFARDFKTFAFKGDVIDLAVGVIIGGAFNTIVTSLANDIIKPLIGAFLGGGTTTLSDLYINLSGHAYANLAAADAATANVIRYGLFLSNLINFIVTALTLFIVLRYLLRYKRDEAKK